MDSGVCWFGRRFGSVCANCMLSKIRGRVVIFNTNMQGNSIEMLTVIGILKNGGEYDFNSGSNPKYAFT